MPSFFIFTCVLALTTSALAAPAILPSILPRNGTDSANGTDSGLDGTHTGQITFYTPAGGLGACGTALADSDAICALSTTLFDKYTPDGNPNKNPLCGKKIKISMTDGRTSTVTVADRCEACVDWDLDLTPPTFTALVSGGLDVGRTEASWQFMS